MTRLRVTTPAGDQIFPLTEQFTIGRLVSNTLSLADDLVVSRKHAVIRRAGSGYVLRDLDSRNGTFVERGISKHRVREEWQLAPGDVIEIGSARLIVEVTEGRGTPQDNRITSVPGTTLYGKVLPEPRSRMQPEE